MEPQRSTPGVETVFLLDPAYRDFLTGKKRRLASSRFAQGCTLLVLVPFLVVGIALLVWGVQQLTEWQQITASSILVRGQVMDRTVSSDSGGEPTYHITYGYEHNDRLYTHRQAVSSDTFSRAEPGSSVDVVYVPANPEIARLAETDEAPQIRFVFVFAFCWNALVWPVFLGGIAGAYGRRTLERKGRIVSGELVSCEGYTDGDGDYALRVEYRFSLPDGPTTIVNKASVTRNDLKGKALPEPGTPLAIVYASRRLYKAL